MFCPKCKGEYTEGITECAECQVSLVDELAVEPEPEYVKWVTVLETGSPGLLVVAKSLLEGDNIPYYAKGEGLQDLILPGRIGTGFNPIVGLVQLQVPRELSRRAQELLAEIKEEHYEEHSSSEEEDDDEKK